MYKMPYFYGSFSAKEPCNLWLFVSASEIILQGGKTHRMHSVRMYMIIRGCNYTYMHTHKYLRHCFFMYIKIGLYLCGVTQIITGWWRLIGCFKLRVIFRKRTTNSRALLRKMTYEDKTSYDSTPPCSGFIYWVATISRLLQINVSFAEHCVFYSAFLQNRPIILESLLIVATPYPWRYNNSDWKGRGRLYIYIYI